MSKNQNIVPVTYKYCVFFFGFFCIIEALKYPIGNVNIYFGDLFYYAYILYNLLIICYSNYQNLRIYTKLNQLYIILFSLVVLSTNFWIPLIDNGTYDQQNGSTPAIKYAVKTLIMLIAFVSTVFLSPTYKKLNIKYFVYGFVSAIYFHALYSFVQIIFWYELDLDIHTTLLNSIGITEESIKHPLINYFMYPFFRPCGLHWDPAYFGLWGVIGIYISFQLRRYKIVKYLLLPILIITWVLSFSRTGWFALVSFFFALYFASFVNKTIKRIKFKNVINGIGLISAFIVIAWLTLPKDYTKIFQTSLQVRINSNTSDEGSQRHINYPIYSIEALLHDPYHLIFGYGARNSSRGIAHTDNISDFVKAEESFDIESDICKMMINYGLFYFILYAYFNIKISLVYLKYADQKNFFASFFTVSLISTFAAGLFYSYNDSKWIWFVYLYSILFLSEYLNTNIYGRKHNNYKLQYI